MNLAKALSNISERLVFSLAQFERRVWRKHERIWPVFLHPYETYCFATLRAFWSKGAACQPRRIIAPGNVVTIMKDWIEISFSQIDVFKLMELAWVKGVHRIHILEPDRCSRERKTTQILLMKCRVHSFVSNLNVSGLSLEAHEESRLPFLSTYLERHKPQKRS